MVKRFLFDYVPYLRGRFRYYGYVVYFPPGSIIFQRACAEGIYESDIIRLILSLVQPGTTYFDVGANIGLLSVPILSTCPKVKVVSIEASPTTLCFLLKTHTEARRKEDWTVIETAVGATGGEAEFWFGGSALGAYDGLHDTGRGGAKHSVRVAVRTLDEIWQDQGCPLVSVIKMDIEGGEYLALQGAGEIIAHSKPIIVTEWTEKNLKSYEIKSEEILILCASMNYKLYAVPNFTPIETRLVLKVAMAQTETFALIPSE